MNAWFSDTHRLHSGLKEFSYGEWLDGFELPVRAEAVKQCFIDLKLGPVLAPPDLGLSPLEAVHDADYLHFLQRAWRMWTALGRSHPALPMIWRAAAQTPDRLPRHIDGQLGYFAQDAECSIVEGTWPAVYWSAQSALSAADDLLAGTRCSFALCRPPGHHARRGARAAICYLNNAAIAAQACRDDGLQRVAILDVDYHHGNGTQDIFYERGDVLFATLHADPHDEYPYFLGHADERGDGAGPGCNLNLPLPAGTDGAAWLQALDGRWRASLAFGARPYWSRSASTPSRTTRSRPSSCSRRLSRRSAAASPPWACRPALRDRGRLRHGRSRTNTVDVLQGHLAAA